MAPSELATSFLAGSAFGARSLVDEEFNCDSVQEVHARFSDPGSVVDTTAKLFFSYRGVPDGNHALKVFWDFDNAPADFRGYRPHRTHLAEPTRRSLQHRRYRRALFQRYRGRHLEGGAHSSLDARSHGKLCHGSTHRTEAARREREGSDARPNTDTGLRSTEGHFRAARRMRVLPTSRQAAVGRDLGLSAPTS